MINDYTIKTEQPLASRLELFKDSSALNIAGDFPYGARVIRRHLDEQLTYEKYRGGYTKAHPDYYLVDPSLRHARLGVTKSDIEIFDSAVAAFESEKAKLTEI